MPETPSKQSGLRWIECSIHPTCSGAARGENKQAQSPTGEVATIHDQKLARGEGGELHQIAIGDTPVLTTAQGGPVSDDQNSLKIGPRGPTLIEGFHFREKLFHFDHERIPNAWCTRVATALTASSKKNDKSLAKYTRADLFQRAGERTPAFVRFSTVAGSKGSVDLARDVRGFAVKLYTQEGNWDIVGNKRIRKLGHTVPAGPEENKFLSQH